VNGLHVRHLLSVIAITSLALEKPKAQERVSENSKLEPGVHTNMNNDSVLQSSGWARAFLVTAWLLPCLGILVNGSMAGTGSMPPSVGYLESGRTLLTLFCFLGFLFSASRRPLSSVGRWALAFLAWGALSSLVNESPFDCFLFWQIWLAPVFFFVAARQFHRQAVSPSSRAGLVHFPVALIAGMALLPIMFEPVFFRIGGVFGLAGVLANWLLFLLPISLYDTLEGRGFQAWMASLASCLSLVAIAYTFSRASWFLACLQFCFVVFLVAPFDRRRFSLITLWTMVGIGGLIAFRESFSTFVWAGAFVAVPVVPIVVEAAASRIKLRHGMKLLALLLAAGLLGFGLSTSESMQTAGEMTDTRLSRLKSFDNSSRARVELWRAAVLMARAHPVLGVGPGDFSVNYPRHQRYFYYYSDSAHCAALELASEVGFVGFGLFIVSLLALLHKGGTAPMEPLQRVALLGIVFGLGYTQIDLAYQFGYLWLTVAVLFLLYLPPPDRAPPISRVNPIQVGLGLLAFGLAFYILPPLRQVEQIKSEKNKQLALATTQNAVQRLPIWRHARLANYQLQIKLDGSSPSPSDTEQLLRRGSSLAATHALIGEWHLQNGRPLKAVEEYRTAIQIDPHNHPHYYSKLRGLGVQLSDEQLVKSSEKTLLEKYSPEKVELAHLGHRTDLQSQLYGGLSDIADGMNPYRQPLKTKPIYRYLYDIKPTPRAAYGLGISLQTLGRTQEARPYLEEAHRKNPVFPAPRSLSE
jgi:tetratricopeptide (TPR) repeat protein